MGATKWMCVLMMLMTVVVTSQAVLTAASAHLINTCRHQCREDEELKAACGEERNCDSLLPDLSAFVVCLEPCAEVGDNCFQRCAFKTDRISSICSRRCRVRSSVTSRPIPIPSDIINSGLGGNAGDNSAGSQCYKSCYDRMLNAAMNRVYRKLP